MTKRVAVAVFALLCFPGLLGARENKAPDPGFVATTERGRLMKEYDVASWHATDAIQALKPVEGSTRYYIAKKGDAGWTVVFGKFNETHDKFLVVYEAVQASGPADFKVIKHNPPIEDAGFYLAGARGIEKALQDFQPANHPYNTYILPTAAGQFYVYLLPATSEDGVYLLGGDVRYLFAADGNAIVEKRLLHKSILEFRATSPGAKTEAGFHTHVLSDVPEDTDVFYVLTRKPSVPEYIGVKKKMTFLVDVDGSIRRVE